MKKIWGWAGSLVLLCTASTSALAQEYPAVSFELYTMTVDEKVGQIPLIIHLSEPYHDDVKFRLDLDGEFLRRRVDLHNSYFKVPAGVTTVSTTLEIEDDDKFYGDQKIYIRLKPVKRVVKGQYSQLNVTIIDDEKVPTVNFTMTNMHMVEKQKTFKLEATLSYAVQEKLKLDLDVRGTTNGRDYELSDRDMIFLPGQTRSHILVTVEEDDRDEPLETLMIYFDKDLREAKPGLWDTFVLTISDDDGGPPEPGLLVHCQNHRDEYIPWRYCSYRSIGSKNTDVLYYFHGFLGSHFQWIKGLHKKRRRAIRQHWSATGQDAPTVINISLGRLWMLRNGLVEGDNNNLLNQVDEEIQAFNESVHNQDQEQHSTRSVASDASSNADIERVGDAEFDSASDEENPPTFDFIADNVIPYIENNEFGTTIDKRVLMGISMGGWNSLQLLMRRPEMWKRAVIISPLITLCNPFYRPKEIFKCIMKDFFARSSFFPSFLSHLLPKRNFKIKEEYDQHNPLNLGETTFNEETPQIYLTGGSDDAFGLYTPNLRLQHLFRKKKVPHQWHPTGEGHSYYDHEKVGDYLNGK